MHATVSSLHRESVGLRLTQIGDSLEGSFPACCALSEDESRYESDKKKEEWDSHYSR
jgi:hypothetical protein